LPPSLALSETVSLLEIQSRHPAARIGSCDAVLRGFGKAES
jgi:hypothetical protein